MASRRNSPSLQTLPAEILNAIFKDLNRPGKLALGLTCPFFLHSFARYYNLDRYPPDHEGMKEKFSRPEGVRSWDESGSQAAIIRWLTTAGEGDEIGGDGDNEPGRGEETTEDEGPDYPGPVPDMASMLSWGMDSSAPADLPPLYDQTELAREDEAVERILSGWIKHRFGISRGCVGCANCSRYMPLGSRWARNMLSRPRYGCNSLQFMFLWRLYDAKLDFFIQVDSELRPL
jgi:hypothetical protein